MHTPCQFLLGTLTIGLALSSTALADPPPAALETAAAVNAANALVREGKFDQAIERFQAIEPPQPLRAERNYNLAVAQYRRGDVAAAKSLFAEVATGQDASLAARSRYNLGNCFYAEAVEAADQDPQTAMAALQTAIEHYRATLHADPQHADARVNIELAAKWLSELKEQEREREEGEQGEPKDEKDEKDESDPSDQGDEQEQQQGQDQQGQDQQGQQQQGESQQDQSQQDQQSQQGQSSSMQDEPLGGEAQGGEPGDEAGDDAQQEVPQGDLTAADPAAQPDPATAAAERSQEDPNGGRMTREEALKMLQAVRDRDMLRRWQHERSERGRRQVVERDW